MKLGSDGAEILTQICNPKAIAVNSATSAEQSLIIIFPTFWSLPNVGLLILVALSIFSLVRLSYFLTCYLTVRISKSIVNPDLPPEYQIFIATHCNTPQLDSFFYSANIY